jgi:hypothetical protein
LDEIYFINNLLLEEGLNWTNTFIAWILLIGIFTLLKPNLFNGIKKFNDEQANIKSFSIFVRNLPSGATRVK